MNFSRTELEAIKALGEHKTSQLARFINKSQKQTYRILKSLREKEIVEKSNLKKEPHIQLLVQVISKYKNLIPLLANSGINILIQTMKEITIKEIQKNTDLNKSIVYRKLREAMNQSIIKKTNKKYKFNEQIWPELKKAIETINIYEQTIDRRIPLTAEIYFKKNNELIFSLKKEFNATKTAFSVFKENSINIIYPTNYYYLPKKKLTKKEILTHALIITEKEPTIRNIIAIALFQQKHKIKLKHEIITKIKEVLNNKEVKGYPTTKDLIDKLEEYNLE